MVRKFLWLILMLLLGSCASGPQFQADSGALVEGFPVDIVGQAEFPAGRSVIWGGEIISTVNQADSTRMEILAYPLDHRQKPMRDDPSQGRFKAVVAGYLEAADYAPHRLVTVQGRLLGRETGKIGKLEYGYPIVAAEKIHLWSTGASPWRSIHFGIGINISN
jgi:outer membrane lipoprotein